MVIGYNENIKLIPYDYSSCASFMEAAVNVFQETHNDKHIFCRYIIDDLSLNETVDIKSIKNKIIDFIQDWLKRILGLLKKLKNIIIERISNNNKSIKDKKDVSFSFESYDLEKITVADLRKFQLFGSDNNFPISSEDSNYEQYIKNRLKEWTGKPDLMECTSGDIKTHILDKYCGGKKITITEKTPGYSYETFDNKSAKKMNDYVDELEQMAENVANSMRSSIKNTADKQISNYMYRAYFNYNSLNTFIITALGGIVADKALLIKKINSYYQINV